MIAAVLLSYWENHAQHRPSAKTERLALDYWTEFWGDQAVSALTPDEQGRFRDWLVSRARQNAPNKPLGKSGIDRILAPGRAALRRAAKYQMLSQAPHIFSLVTAEAKRGRAPKGRPLSIEELAALFNAASSVHMLRYLMIAVGTLARPGAIVELQAVGYDSKHHLIDMNPPGREQNKKFRPLLPVVPTLRPWLARSVGSSGQYIEFRGGGIQNIVGAWRVLRRAAKLDERVMPYSIRHTMGREMRKRRVPTEEIGIFLGHRPDDSTATTSIYAPFEPDYVSNAAAAIEDVFALLRPLVRAGLIDPPTPDAAPALRPRKSGPRIPQDKLDRVRDLILAGVAHMAIVEATGVSSGTVSSIRQEIKAQIPVLRATGCVTIALRGKPGALGDEEKIQ